MAVPHLRSRAVTFALAAAGAAALTLLGLPEGPRRLARAEDPVRDYPPPPAGEQETYSGLAPYFVAEGDWWDTNGPARGDSRTVSQGAPTRVVVGPYLASVHADVPAGTAVQFLIRRVGGSAPDVLWAQDAEGRAWTPSVAVLRRSMITEQIPVLAEGGIDLVLTPTRTARCVVEVSVRTEPFQNGTAPDPGTPWVPGQVVIPIESIEDAQALADELGVDLLEMGDGYAVFGTPDRREGLEWIDAAWLTDLAKLGPGFGFEPDSYAEPPEGSQTNLAVVGSDFGRMYPRQPAFRTIGLPPLPRTLRGGGVVVGVLDSGIDAAHPAFAGRLLPGKDFVDGDDDPSETLDGADDDGDGRADDGYGHGTVVAGIALAIAPDARILPVRVLDDEGVGTSSRVAEGIRWAVQQGAKVLNLSLGTRSWSATLEDAVRYATVRGVIVVVSAGNDGDRWTVDFPADVQGTIAVTAAGLRGRRARFGNGNRATTLLAPGVNVIGPYPAGRWALCTGTSFSAPFASGAAALLLEREPLATAERLRELLTSRSRLDVRPLFR